MQSDENPSRFYQSQFDLHLRTQILIKECYLTLMKQLYLSTPQERLKVATMSLDIANIHEFINILGFISGQALTIAN